MNKTFILRDADIVRNCINFMRSAEALKEFERRDYEVNIKEHKPKKTAEQEAFFHVLCRELHKETGLAEWEVKAGIKAMVFGVKEIKLGSRKQTVVPTSKDLSKEEYSQLIEACYLVGAEAGCVLPTPRWRE